VRRSPPRPIRRAPRPRKRSLPSPGAKAPKQAPKQFAGAPDATNVQQAEAAPQTAAKARASSNGTPQPKSLRAAGAPRRDAQLTARYVAEPEKPEIVKKPAPAPMPPLEQPPEVKSGVTVEAQPEAIEPGEVCDSDCCGHGGWCAGVEYLYLRPHLSNDVAFHELTASTVGDLVTNDNRAVPFQYQFDSDYRIFAGLPHAMRRRDPIRLHTYPGRRQPRRHRH